MFLVVTSFMFHFRMSGCLLCYRLWCQLWRRVRHWSWWGLVWRQYVYPW